MRMIDWNEKEDYQPLERGNAFVQFYENGDKFDCHNNAFDWHHYFWHYCLSAGLGSNDQIINLMGGEL